MKKLTSIPAVLVLACSNNLWCQGKINLYRNWINWRHDLVKFRRELVRATGLPLITMVSR